MPSPDPKPSGPAPDHTPADATPKPPENAAPKGRWSERVRLEVSILASELDAPAPPGDAADPPAPPAEPPHKPLPPSK